MENVERKIDGRMGRMSDERIRGILEAIIMRRAFYGTSVTQPLATVESILKGEVDKPDTTPNL